jgi:hypothetical protein
MTVQPQPTYPTYLAVTHMTGHHVDLSTSSRMGLVSGTDEVDAPTPWKHNTNLGIWARASQ